MPIFEFSLQRVLDFKIRVEERIQGELAAIIAEFEAVKSEIDLMDGRIEDSKRDLHGSLTSLKVDTFEIQGYRNYIRRLGMEREALVERSWEIEDRLAIKRDELVEAMREKKVLEKLSEKELAKFTKNMLAREQAMLDEMALIKRGGLDA